ncbi:hypothetical protein F5H01DRAFT_164878 [Linnemannia elongata]|nr:hypothetical protein F5H01DRAFT_164878 [Linnemannia elongata]
MIQWSTGCQCISEGCLAKAQFYYLLSAIYYTSYPLFPHEVCRHLLVDKSWKSMGSFMCCRHFACNLSITVHKSCCRGKRGGALLNRLMWRNIEDDRIPMLPSAGYFFWWLATTLATRTDKKQGPRMKKGSEVWTCLFTFMHFIIIFSTMHKQMTKCGSERGIWCCRSLPLFCKYYPSTLPFLLPCTFCALSERQPKCRVINEQSIGKHQREEGPS